MSIACALREIRHARARNACVAPARLTLHSALQGQVKTSE
jgi:hypothetical protein